MKSNIPVKVAKRLTALKKSLKKQQEWPDGCFYCGKPFNWPDNPPHVDDYHRFTPLCASCYGSAVKRKVTEYLYGDYS